jgi:hypothetical protein
MTLDRSCLVPGVSGKKKKEEYKSVVVCSFACFFLIDNITKESKRKKPTAARIAAFSRLPVFPSVGKTRGLLVDVDQPT